MSESLDFLRRFHPGRLWVLTAIGVDKSRIVTRTFGENSIAELESFLQQHAGGNIYYSVAEPLGPVSKKTEKTDLRAVHWLHVDLDPRVGEDITAERTRILATLRDPKGLPPPTVIVDSGGGYQAFWKLDQPIPIDGDLAKAEEADLYNRQIEVQLGGDHCHNVDRIARLPGTWNRPDERKRKRGRVDAPALLVSWADHVYPITAFSKASPVGTPAGFTPARTSAPPSNVRRVASLDELPGTVPLLCKVVIAQGRDPDNPAKWPSRSEAVFWVTCELVRANVDDDTIFSILTDPDWGISASILDKGRTAAKYAMRQIERAHEEAIDPMLRAINDQYALVGNANGRCRILTETDSMLEGTRRRVISLLSIEDFCHWFRNKRVSFPGPNGQPSSIEAGKWWLMHPNRREYKTVCFEPGRDTPGVYNLWKGFSYDPAPGSCDLYLNHIREVLCRGREELYRYLIGWMATCVQRPAQPGHVAVVLRGKQGTGKGVFASVFGSLFGPHYVAVRDPNHLFGQFNAHLRDCLVLFADEAFWAGNKKHEGQLKALVTEPTVLVEAKGVDATVANSYIHLILASNEEWVVPAAIDDRRFFVLDVGGQRARDSAYFSAILRQMREEGGFSALLHFLLNYDLSEYDVRKIPQTAALRDQKVHSFTTEVEWWFNKLRDGRLTSDREWGTIFATELQYDFISHCKAWNIHNRSTITRLGRFLNQVCPGQGVERTQIRGTHPVRGIDGQVTDVARPHAYRFPDLETCRAWFDKHFGGPFDWPEVEPIEEQDRAL